MNLNKLTTGVFAAGLLSTSFAFATPVLELSSGGTTVSVSDGGLGDVNGAAGAVTFVGVVGGFNSNVTTGHTAPIIGSEDWPELDLNSVNVSGAAGTIDITFTDTGFNTLSEAYLFQSSIGGTTDGTINWSYCLFDSSNTCANNTVSDSFSGLSDAAFKAGSFDSFDLSGWDATFGVSLMASVTHTSAAQNTSFNFSVKRVPEPASVALLGLGLVGLGFARRVQKA